MSLTPYLFQLSAPTKRAKRKPKPPKPPAPLELIGRDYRKAAAKRREAS